MNDHSDMIIVLDGKDPQADLSQVHALRRRVFVDEQGVSEAEEMDGLDHLCLHLLLIRGDQALGTARLRQIDETLKIQRVCVSQEHRGKGHGELLIRHAVEYAKAERAISECFLSSQLSAIAFYEKLGFEARGPVYDDAGIPHRDMHLTV